MIQTIYLHKEWGKLQEYKENGIAEIYTFESDEGKVSYPFIKRHAGVLNGVEYFDIVTSRGESGPVIEFENGTELLHKFDLKFQKYCDDNNIIAEYIRFDPWNTRIEKFEGIYDIQPHGKAFCHKLKEDFFMTQYSTKRRNQIRKAIKSGVELELEADVSKLGEFLKLYEYTIDKHSIGKYYLLDETFLKNYFTALSGRVRLGFAYYEDKPIAAGIFLNGGDVFHYHFSASHPNYTQLNAISYLLMEEAKLGASDGCSIMDLGGATPNSGLEKFKQSMTREEQILPCYVGTKIRNSEKYQALVDQVGGPRVGFFPAYRK